MKIKHLTIPIHRKYSFFGIPKKSIVFKQCLKTMRTLSFLYKLGIKNYVSICFTNFFRHFTTTKI